ncbi:hypothetical protein C823_007536 [Eubacterium plexicaudatum ASF492]|nr:hypothetical protein C823_007536 [Eubacterium plexicaudatum ASF492]
MLGNVNDTAGFTWRTATRISVLESTAWPELYRIIFRRTRFKKAAFFCSAAGGQTASKDFYGKATALCLFIKDSKRGAFSGQEQRQKPVRSHRNSSHG